MNGSSDEDRLRTATQAAAAAGAVIRKGWVDGRPHARAKANALDLVTQVDVEAEVAAVRVIREAFPLDGIVSEEQTALAGSTGYEWVIDPLDGTLNFVSGIPHFCVSIACRLNRDTVAGVILDPLRHETFATTPGAGCNWTALQDPVPERATLHLSTWSLRLADDSERSRIGSWQRHVRPQIGGLRWVGSLALALAWTALGRFDALFYESPYRAWDYAAGELLCAEAGLAVVHMPARDQLLPAIAVVPAAWESLLEALL